MLSLIVAFDRNRVIGKDNEMPWHYPQDLRYFKEKTLNHKVVMGANTFKSIIHYLGKPFPGRETIVVSHVEVETKYDGVVYYDNLEIIKKLYCETEEEVFIAGGMSIYEQMIDNVDRLYITHIDKEFDGDAYFPEIDYSLFKLVNSNKIGELDFCVYERI